MGAKFIRFLKNPWVVGILGSLIASIIYSAISSLFSKDTSFWQAFSKLFVNIGTFILNILTLKIPLFFALLCVIFTIILFYIISLIRDLPSSCSWKNYTEDKIGNIHFKWDYNFTKNGYSIINLYPVCDCGCSLSVGGLIYNRKLFCPNCKKEYSFINDFENIKKVIYYRIEKGEYTMNKDQNPIER